MTNRIHTVAAMFAMFGVSLSDLDRRGPREAGKPGEWERKAIADAEAKRERRRAKRRGER